MLVPKIPTALLVLALAAPVASAQFTDTLPGPPATGGSTQHLSLLPGLAAGAGNAGSALHVAELSVAGPAGDYHAESLLHRLVGGVLAVEPSLVPTSPLVAGVTPHRVAANGGESVVIHGLALSPGGIAPVVRLDGLPAAGVIVQGDGSLLVEVPALVNENSTPLGLVDVEVETLAGVDVLKDGLIATAAYLQSSPARLGSTLSITHYGEPGGLGLPFWGKEIPGVVFPVPPLDGVLELAQILYMASAEALDATGVASTVWPIPANPSLVGLELQFQAIAAESISPLIASFTNVVTVRIEP